MIQSTKIIYLINYEQVSKHDALYSQLIRITINRHPSGQNRQKKTNSRLDEIIYRKQKSLSLKK